MLKPGPQNPITPTLTTSFTGYGHPGYTTIPDLFLDFQMQDLSEAEIKVMLYIFRRTYGWKKEQDAISYNQFLNGITTRDGRQLDRGAGISRSSLWKALKLVAEKEYIFTHKFQSGSGEKETTIYELNLDGQPHWQPGSSNSEPPVVQISNRPGSSDFEPTINNIKQKTSSQHTTPVAVVVLQQIQTALENAGIHRPIAATLASIAASNGRGPNYIHDWQTYLLSQKSFKNPAGYLNRMVRENADPPAQPSLAFTLKKYPVRPVYYCPNCDVFSTTQICDLCGGPAPALKEEANE